MHTLYKYLLYKIASYLPLKFVVNLKLSCHHLNKILNNDIFWSSKIKYDFGLDHKEKCLELYKSIYFGNIIILNDTKVHFIKINELNRHNFLFIRSGSIIYIEYKNGIHYLRIPNSTSINHYYHYFIPPNIKNHWNENTVLSDYAMIDLLTNSVKIID